MTKINFMGDEIAHTVGGKITSFLGRPEIIANAGWMVLTFYHAATEHTTPHTLVARAVINELFLALSTLTCRWTERNFFLRDQFSDQDLENKYINTNPDFYQPFSASRYGIGNAQRLRMIYLGFAAVITVLPGSPYLGVTTIAQMARMFSGWHRWRKVTTGEWTIENKPPSPHSRPRKWKGGRRLEVLHVPR